MPGPRVCLVEIMYNASVVVSAVKMSTYHTIRDCQSKDAISILWSHHEETLELPGERDNARNNARCTQVRKTTHNVAWTDNIKTWTGRVSQNGEGCHGDK